MTMPRVGYGLVVYGCPLGAQQALILFICVGLFLCMDVEVAVVTVLFRLAMAF